MEYRLKKITESDDPFWLLLFPEGTNFSPNTLPKSEAYSKKMDLPVFNNVLLPRVTGLRSCLKTLQPSVKWVYDVTLAYEGVKKGEYAQDYYTLTSLLCEGVRIPGVHMHIRKYSVSDIPMDDDKLLLQWLVSLWEEKDKLLDEFYKHGKFLDIKTGPFEGSMKLRQPFGEMSSIFTIPITVLLTIRSFKKASLFTKRIKEIYAGYST